MTNQSAKKYPVSLTIAGSDPSGGAGIQADLKTFHQFGVYGMSVITLITVQNTRGISQVIPLDAKVVGAQLDAVLEDIPPDAIKIGALGSAEIIREIVPRLRNLKIPLIVDSVIASSYQNPLLTEDGISNFIEELLPIATLLTPNMPEAELLLSRILRKPVSISTLEEMSNAAQKLCSAGCKAALIKGGHRSGDATDVLFVEGEEHLFKSERVNSQSTHGTGCTLSAAIAARLACGASLTQALGDAKHFVTHGIQTAPGLGKGNGPLSHFSK